MTSDTHHLQIVDPDYPMEFFSSYNDFPYRLENVLDMIDEFYF